MSELKSIESGNQRLKFGEKLKASWYFNTLIDKTILLAMALLSIYALARIAWQGVW